MSGSMEFSVIIPAYNCENTIYQTVQSICGVNIDNMEVIIVDDGSQDRTSEVCKIISFKYPIVKYFFQNNSGVSVARNYGLSKAKGKYILFWDSDDKANTELLQKCIKTAKKYNPDMLIFGMSFQKKYNGKVIQVENKQCTKEEIILKQDFSSRLVEMFDINYLSSGCNKIYKRRICEKISFNPSKKTFEDLLYVLEYTNNCTSILLMPDIVYLYEVNYPLHNKSRLNMINNFNEYMFDFQKSVLQLENTLGCKIPQLRARICQVYEWMLSGKIESCSYFELKQIDMNKMEVSLFGSVYQPKMKVNRLFLGRKFFRLRVKIIYRSIRDCCSVILKAIFLYR